jgi:hypothetical protein
MEMTGRANPCPVQNACSPRKIKDSGDIDYRMKVGRATVGNFRLPAYELASMVSSKKVSFE